MHSVRVYSCSCGEFVIEDPCLCVPAPMWVNVGNGGWKKTTRRIKCKVHDDK